MKCPLLVWFSFVSIISLAQADSAGKIEPGQETSFDNYELLIIAIAGLVILMGLRFWFRRTRKR